MATIHPWYDDRWRQSEFDCPECDWSGTPARMSSDLHAELADYSCPRCDRMILIVPFPTLDDIRTAAAAGIPQAVARLADLEGRSPD